MHNGLTLSPGQVTEWVLLENITNQMKQMAGKSHNGFTKDKSWQTKRTNFYNIITSSIDMERAVDDVYLDFSKAFDTISHSILLAETDWVAREIGRKLTHMSHSKGGDKWFLLR